MNRLSELKKLHGKYILNQPIKTKTTSIVYEGRTKQA